MIIAGVLIHLFHIGDFRIFHMAGLVGDTRIKMFTSKSRYWISRNSQKDTDFSVFNKI